MRSKFEIRAQKELEADNWFVDWKVSPRRTPIGYNRDYWNLFDLLAYQGKMIRAIAIKGQGGVPRELRQKIENFEVCEHFVKEIWTYTQLRKTVKGKRVRQTNQLYRIRKEIIE